MPVAQGPARPHRRHQGDAEDHQGHADGRGGQAAPRPGRGRGRAALCRAHGKGARQSRGFGRSQSRRPAAAGRHRRGPRPSGAWSAPPSADCAAPFNSAIVRLARERANALLADGKEVKFICVGRKGATSCAASMRAASSRPSTCARCARSGFENADEIGRQDRRAMFAAGEFDVCTLFFSRFRSVIAQIPTAQQLIPAVFPAAARTRRRDSTNTSPTRRTFSPSCCRATSRCRCSARCWRTPPPSTAPR